LSNKAFRQLLTVVVLLILITIITGTSIQRTLQCDEASTLYKYAHNPISAILGYTTPNNHLLHSLLMWITTNLMGMSHIGVRFTAFMAGILTCALGYRIGRKLHNHYSGIGVMLILATNLEFVQFMLDGRGYTLSALFTLALIYIVIVVPKKSNKRHRILELLLSFALLMVIPSMALYIGAILLLLGIQYLQSRNYTIIRQIVSIITGGIIAFMFYLPAIVIGDILSTLGGFGEPSFMVLITRWLELAYLPMIFGVLYLLATLIGFIVLYRIHKHYTLLACIGLIVVVAFGAAILQDLLTGRTLFARNYLYLVPVLAISGGIGLGFIFRRYITIVAILIMLGMSPFISQIRGAEAITQLIEAIPQYQPDVHLFAQHACHILPAYYELTVIQEQNVNIISASNPETSILPIPVGLKMSIDSIFESNFIDRETFGECQLVDDEFDWLDIYLCEVKP